MVKTIQFPVHYGSDKLFISQSIDLTIGSKVTFYILCNPKINLGNGKRKEPISVPSLVKLPPF
jgi:hypothetical protein